MSFQLAIEMIAVNYILIYLDYSNCIIRNLKRLLNWNVLMLVLFL